MPFTVIRFRPSIARDYPHDAIEHLEQTPSRSASSFQAAASDINLQPEIPPRAIAVSETDYYVVLGGFKTDQAAEKFRSDVQTLMEQNPHFVQQGYAKAYQPMTKKIGDTYWILTGCFAGERSDADLDHERSDDGGQTWTSGRGDKEKGIPFLSQLPAAKLYLLNVQVLVKAHPSLRGLPLNVTLSLLGTPPQAQRPAPGAHDGVSNGSGEN